MDELGLFQFASLDEATEFYQTADLNQMDDEELSDVAYSATLIKLLSTKFEEYRKYLPFWEGLFHEIERIFKNQNKTLIRCCLSKLSAIVCVVDHGTEKKWKKNFSEMILAKYSLIKLENWLDDEISQPCVCSLLTEVLVEEIERRKNPKNRRK